MTSPLFQLGDFQFDIPNGVPQTLDRHADFRWEEQPRLLREPAWQYVGPGSQKITLDGVLFPQFTGTIRTLDQLRALAEPGDPLMFTDGMGRVFGLWCIASVKEKQSTYLEGGAPRKIDFTLELVKYGEDNPGQAAAPTSTQPGADLLGASVGPIAPLVADASAWKALDWAQNPQFSAMTQQALGSGFSLGNLGTLANVASQAAGVVSQVQAGNFVGGALSLFGMAGIPIDQSDTWTQIGINAANLAQSYAQGNGPTGMSLALEAVAGIGAPAVQALAGENNQTLQNLNALVTSVGQITSNFQTDPKVTQAVSAAITLTGG